MNTIVVKSTSTPTATPPPSDTEMLDWLEEDLSRVDTVLVGYVALIPPPSFRSAIRAAMRAEAKP